MYSTISRSRGLAALQHTTRHFSSTLQNKEKQKFLAVAKDFTDDKALERRLSVREEHLAKARQSKIEKRIAMGGALLDSHEKMGMQGSFFIINADSIEEAKKIITDDIYYTSKVWEKFEIYPVKIAPLPKVDDE